MPATYRPGRIGRRARYEATDADRNRVSLMVVAGCDQNDICSVLRINRNTLHKHFRSELDASYARVKSRIAGKLIALADAGNLGAMIFYLKTHGWSERITVVDGGLEHQNPRELTDDELNARIARLQRNKAAVMTRRKLEAAE